MIHSIALTVNLGVIIDSSPSLKLYIQSVVHLLNFISHHGPRSHLLSSELLPWTLLSIFHREDEAVFLKHKSDLCHPPYQTILWLLIMLKMKSKKATTIWTLPSPISPLKPSFYCILPSSLTGLSTTLSLETIAPAVLTVWRTLLSDLCVPTSVLFCVCAC